METSKDNTNYTKDFLIPILQIVISIISILTTAYIAYANIKSNEEMKHYEISFSAKQKNYSAFTSSLYQAFAASAKEDGGAALLVALDNIESARNSIEPFLEKEKIAELTRYTSSIKKLCLDSHKAGTGRDNDLFARTFESQHRDISTKLRQWLFK